MTTTFSRALFAELRPDFFRVPAAPAARLYADALNALEQAIARRAQGIEREEALEIIEEAIDAHADAPLEESAPGALNTREKARTVLDYLVQTGWLEDEQQSDWQRIVNIHSGGIAILRVLRLIAFPDSIVFSDKIVNACTTLVLRDAANDPFSKEPWQHVESCIELLQAGIGELRGMRKAIEWHTQRQLSAGTLKENLNIFFDQFAQGVGNTCYSELVRARLPLRLMEARRRVADLERDVDLLDKMQAELMRRSPSLQPEAAMSHVRIRLQELADLLESVVPIADSVDRRTAEFTRRSLARFRYLQETASENRAKVQRFFELLNHNFAGSRIADIDGEVIDFPQLLIRDTRMLAGLESLYRPHLRRTAGEIEAVSEEPTDIEQQDAIKQFQAEIRNSLTVGRANRFVEQILSEEGASIRSDRIPFQSEEDLNSLIACLLHAYAQDARYQLQPERDPLIGGVGVSNGQVHYDYSLDSWMERFTITRK